MPRKGAPTPELAEPYEQYLYAELRHELVSRNIRIGNGPQRITKRTGFIAALRKWDSKRGQPTPPQPQEKASRTRTSAAKKAPAPRKTPQKPQSKQPPTTAMTSTRVVRARRGCRFRLINVLLSADFSGRWAEMLADGRLEVNQLWLDVHAAFLAHSSELDTLHFEDALFVNVTPNVILTHSAERLLHMWAEIVAMYRTAVAQAKDAAAHNDNVHSFFDFCAGRLDLLYLHMAMLLEPKLYEFIMSDKIPAVDPFTRGGKATASATTTTTTVTATPTPAAATKAKHTSKSEATAKATVPAAAKKVTHEAAVTSATTAPVKAALVANSGSASAPAAPPTAAVAAPAMMATPAAPIAHAKPSRVPTQNPEMEEAPELVSAKGPTTAAQAKPTAAKATKASGKAKQAKPTALPHKPAAHKKPQNAAGKGKATTGTSPANDTKQTASPSKRKATAPAKQKATSQSVHAKAPSQSVHAKAPSQTAHAKAPSQTAHAKAPSKPSNGKSSLGAKPASASKPANGKRRREEEDATAIVEVPSVSDIVPHPGKRAHTTTTTISTLATRPSDAMLPPDEWDILENRLRKVNENIDRCHRGLASVEGSVSESYKQSLEADLRFYSAIKQRLQEQLLVVMQSGY